MINKKKKVILINKKLLQNLNELFSENKLGGKVKINSKKYKKI